MANEERLCASPRTRRFATGEAQILILSSFAIHVMYFNLRDLSSSNILDTALLAHVAEIDTANVDVWVSMKVNQKAHAHAKKSKIVPQLPEMLR